MYFLKSFLDKDKSESLVLHCLLIVLFLCLLALVIALAEREWLCSTASEPSLFDTLETYPCFLFWALINHPVSKASLEGSCSSAPTRHFIVRGIFIRKTEFPVFNGQSIN